MPPLRVAACPRCKAALVFGERACRSCGQTFQYGATPPPEPTFVQILESLAAVGAPLPPGAVPTPAVRPTNPFDSVIESGRFKPVADVVTEDVPGLIDSTLFAAFTPKHVDVAPVSGLDNGRFADVGDVRSPITPGLETAPAEVGDVFTQPVSGLFGSDIFKTDPGIDFTSANPDGFEPSPSSTRPPKVAAQQPAERRPSRKAREFGTVMCRCGERHNLERCPSCGTLHPDA